ncbi:MAG: hypothetical protein GWN99_03795 [Gemmatimonadetes bacterium]|uniref:Glycosyltransferase RgtA/B/C/D-like domain-containing protein n=1 Tax=Candidatus Kutchimonas denitrificans TaxID=3056748 RepID=A0AAE4Z911_9BACT|nr:hypothetical protein [Gemmatimonadota bacterium]NIR75253.1 hypothetical protein [Candidatus Kutchimonas denitrificans]NIS00191.1 hypothetical protein [Gemmatimonadota bacterium]NIT65783.1 hypothetical protein [Gemmatimonadota bacterium]NIU53061.1 hypothetical protein [Gemmatimonadota bacterium]
MARQPSEPGKTPARLGPLQHPLIWLCAAHVLLAVLLFDPKPFLGGDNYWYMLLGESLRTGEGYRDLWLPSTPAHTRYPPLYPALLAFLGLIKVSPVLFKLFSLACTTAVTALVFLLTERRTGDRQLALLAGGLAAAAPILVEYAHWVLSEPLFTVLVLVAVYAFSRDDAAGDVKIFAVGTGAAILASLARSAGYPLLLAILVSLAARRRWKRCAIFLGAVIVVLGSWWLRNRLAVSGDLPYTQWILFRDPYRPELGTVGAAELVGRFFHNLQAYALRVLPQSMAGRDVSGFAAGVLGTVATALPTAAALRNLKQLRVTELFFIFYMGLILLWPEAWSDQRLLLPALPVIFVLLVEGLAWVAGKVDRQGRRAGAVTFVVGALLVAVAVLGNLRLAARELDCARAYWRGNRFACYPAAVVDFIRTANWTAQNTDRQAIVVNRKPQIFYWYGRRRGDNYPYTEDTDSVMHFLDSLETDYVIVDRWSATTFRYLIPAIQANADRFGLAHQEGQPATFLLTYSRSGGGR